MSVPPEQLEGLSAEELIEALESGSVGPSGFLGLEGAPADFEARRAARPRTDPSGEQFGFVDVAPRFTQDDLGAFYALSAEERWRLQLDMHNAGVLDEFVPGDADDRTLAAFEGVLGFANRNGYTKVRDAIDALSRARDRREELLGGALDGPQLPAPEDVRPAVEQALIARMGRAPQDAVDAMTEAYRGVVQSRLTGPTAPPSVEGFVEGQVEGGEFAEEAGAFDFARQALSFYSMLGAPPGPQPQGGPF